MLEAFRGYSAAAKEVCMGGPNLAEHTFEEGRVRTREVDWQRRTLYLGGKAKPATGEEDGEKVQGTPGLEVSKAWEEEIPEDNKVTWEDARRRLGEEEAARGAGAGVAPRRINWKGEGAPGTRAKEKKFGARGSVEDRARPLPGAA